MRRLPLASLMWLLLAGVLTACAPARIELDPRVREVLPAASVVHVVAYPTDAPSNRPTLDEIEADDGVAYWRMLGDAIAACATDLLKQYRGEAPPPS